MKHRRASRAKVLRLFYSGWSFRLLARWYGLPVLLVEDLVRLDAIRRGWRAR